MANPPAKPARQGGRLEEHRVVVREGPLPSPHDLAAYDAMVPGSAERIISMAEREQAHRMNMDDMAHRADIRHRDDVAKAQRDVARGVFGSDLLGQILGAFVAILCVAGAVYTAINGAHPTIPIALVGLPIATIIKAIRSTGGSERKSGK